MQDRIMLAVGRLAHNNGMSIQEFVDTISKDYAVDISELPRNEDGNIVYPDGTIGIDVALSNEEELMIYEASYVKNVTTNQFMLDAVMSAIENKHV